MTHHPEFQQSTSSLSCETFEDRIHQILDDRLTLTGDALLMEHAAQCATCEDKLIDFDSVDDSIKLLKDDIDKILSQVEQPRRKPLTDRPIALIATLAAILLVCVAVFQGLDTEGSNQLASRLVTANNAPIVNSGGPNFGATMPRMKPAPQTERRVTPDTSPFSKNFNVANTIPRIPTASNWQDVSKHLQPFEPVLNYSIEIPGIRTMQTSISVTFELIRQSFTNSETDLDPDLGFTIDPDWMATA